MNFPFELTGSLELVWRATWQAVLLAIIVWLAVSVFRRWLTPRWRTLLWTIPLLRFSLLVLPASSVSLYGLVEHPKAPKPPAARLVTEIETPLLSAESMPQPPAAIGNGPRIPSGKEDFVSSNPLPVVVSEPNTGREISTTEVLRILWIGGVVIFFLHWCLSQILLRRMLSRCRPLADLELTSWIRQSSHKSAGKRRIRYLMTEEDIGPASCGLWRPVVILPQQLLNELTGEELQTVIRHEVVHIRRYDGLLLLLSRFATVIHWFNPLVYFIGRRLRREMELAVDATAMRGLAEQGRKAYGELLLKLSQRPAGRFGLVEMANSRSEVGKRIDQISAPPQESRLSTTFAVGLIALLTLSGLSEAALMQQEAPAVAVKQTETKQDPVTETATKPKSVKKYFIEGTVRDASNQAPVEGAEVRILIESEPDLDKKSRKAVTNKNGKYRIEVPLGHVLLWQPALKPGYWLKSQDQITSLITTPGRPTVTHDLTAQPGPIWRVKVKGDLKERRYRIISMYDIEDDAKRKAWLNHENVSFEQSPPHAMSTVDNRGNGQVTEPGSSRQLIINAAGGQVEVIAEPEFDNTRVVSARRREKSGVTELTDNHGYKATITGAAVTLEDGKPLLTLETQTPKPGVVQKLTGSIVDTNGRPLEGVKLGVALGSKGGGSGMGRVSVETDRQGRFTLELPIASSIQQKASEYQVSLVLTKQEYAGKDTEYYPLSPNLEPIDVGTITMQPGFSIPVRVLDDQGQPAAGAVIRPGDSYALRMESARTDEEGRAVVRNLPAGRVSFNTQLGNLHQTSYLIVSADPKENQEITIQVQELSTLLAAPQKLKPLSVGTQAPELKVTEWSDGKQRSLADYRGKVVVLEFWGVWCSGCITMIPTQQKLADKYEKQGVVFLGIHTAGGEMEQIRKLKKLKKWSTPTAIDRGALMQESETGRAYGIRGLPALLILDRDGKIAFRSDIEPENVAEYQAEIAKLAGVAWPPAADLSQAEEIAMADKIFTALFSREIERVLSAKK